MAYIEKRKEGNKNIWVFKYAALFYWLIWPTIAVSILASRAEWKYWDFLAVILWLSIILLAIPFWPSVFRLKKQMKEKGIQAKGSKYSFSNPLRYEWED